MVGTANSLGQLAGLPLAGMISDRVLPEPVRWLMARGQPSQARVMLERAARQNGVVFDEDRLQRVFGADDAEEEKKKVSGGAQAPALFVRAEATARSS
ncbi:Protein of unknown function, partial [Gryllus bimaculatus]